MTERPSSTSGSPVLKAIGNFFKFLLRFLFVLVIGVLIGVGVYYGIPWLYRSLVQPVQQNTLKLAALEQRLDQEQSRLQNESHALQERIAALEVEVTKLKEQSAVQAQDFSGAKDRLQLLEDRITQAEADLKAQAQAVEKMRAALEDEIANLGEQSTTLAERADVLEGRTVLLLTAQDLLKVRLLLLEESPRAARETLALAAAHLAQAESLMPDQAERLTGLQARIAVLDGLVEQRSYRVGPELESLWADVMDIVLPGTSVPPLAVTPTSPEVTGTPTPFPTPTPYLTPTPTPAPQP